MGATLRTSQSKQEMGGLGETEVRWCLRFFKPREGCRILLAWKASPVEEKPRKERAGGRFRGPWAPSDSLGGRCYRSVLLEI